jgi:hypothetical protein
MRALPVLVMTPLVARLATRLDFRLPLCASFLLSAASFGLLAPNMRPQSDFSSFADLIAFSGAGQAMLLAPVLVGLLGA